MHQITKQESMGEARVAEISFYYNKEYLTISINQKVESHVGKCIDSRCTYTWLPWSCREALVPGAAVPASTPWVGLDETVFEIFDTGLLRAVIRKKIYLFILPSLIQKFRRQLGNRTQKHLVLVGTPQSDRLFMTPTFFHMACAQAGKGSHLSKMLREFCTGRLVWLGDVGLGLSTLKHCFII